jgi:cytochrome c oxidase subunit 1
MMGLTGIFGVIAVIGGGLWILLVVGSLLFGKKLDGGATHDKPVPIPDQTAAAAASHTGSEEHVGVPGTVVLAITLLVCFVLYYFVNWKYLSEVWGLS